MAIDDLAERLQDTRRAFRASAVGYNRGVSRVSLSARAPGVGAGLQDGFVEDPAGKTHRSAAWFRKGILRVLPVPLRAAPIPLLAAVTGAGMALALLGCQQQYRPVVSAINPVGPAGQPSKYAVAISSPSSTAAGLTRSGAAGGRGISVITSATFPVSGPRPAGRRR